ncbi:hypothetical protein GUJ93_ZPchr0011g28431 [Zizania palustris]|uniref:Uncharacterized protein n=1 Tax=Zizania palustris TaxID=103762 RepID=A0A8J6BQW3_ZIZPA|nr:hypothetical protein GUJ93_ZPchr0011g28431 [Zizania palustris]
MTQKLSSWKLQRSGLVGGRGRDRSAFLSSEGIWLLKSKFEQQIQELNQCQLPRDGQGADETGHPESRTYIQTTGS